MATVSVPLEINEKFRTEIKPDRRRDAPLHQTNKILSRPLAHRLQRLGDQNMGQVETGDN